MANQVLENNNNPNFYKLDNPDHKFYFAAYCNMALQNTGKILNSILAILDSSKSPSQNENELHVHSIINKLGNTNNGKEDLNLKSSILDLLDRHLPFALVGSKNLVMGQKSPESISKRLQIYIKTLIFFRNYYSHFAPGVQFNSLEVKSEKEKTAFFDVLQDIKKKAVQTSEKRLDLDIKSRFAKATNQTATESGMIDYKDFKNDFFSNTNDLNENTNDFNENTFLFFLSLFLTKGQTTELLNHIRGKKSSIEPEHFWIRNIFLVINAKDFQVKLKSSEPKEALSLNLLNELSRFPVQLSKYLTKEGHENLIVKEDLFTDSSLNDNNSEENDNNSEEPRTIKLLRYGNSFSYNALQFLEYNNLLPKMNFQLNLGQVYTHEPYNKEIGDYKGKRELTKSLLVHGKLKNYDDSFYQEYIKREEGKIPEFKEPLKYYRPKYHFEGNRIGITLGKEDEKIELSDYKKKDGEKNQKVFKHSNKISDFIISEKILPSLVYCALHRKEKEVKNTFYCFRNNFRKFLKDITENNLLDTPELQKLQSLSNIEESKAILEKFLNKKYNLKLQWIPSKIINFILNKATDEKSYTLKKLDFLIDRANFLSNGEKIKDRAKGKKKVKGFFHFSFKKGDKATEVARDIIRMMETDKKKKKLSSAEYNLLQSLLALKSIEDCEFLFNSTNLNYRHPFLPKINIKVKKVKKYFAPMGIKTFFTKYFEASEYYLKELKEKVERGIIKPKDSILHFIDYGSFFKSKKDIESYARNLLTKKEKQYIHPIYIPNDLLKNLVLEINKNKNPVESIKTNINYALMLGFKQEEKQWFYDEKFRESVDDIKVKTLNKKFNHEWLKDSIVWQMLKMNGNEELNKALNEFSLSNYKVPENKETGSDHILSMEVNQKIEFTLKNQHSLKIKKDEERKAFVEFNKKIKDLGTYRHLLKDFRIPYILGYYLNHKDILDVDVIKNELAFYDKKRFEILDKIFTIEKSCYKKNTNLYNNCKKDEHINFKMIINSFFPNKSKELREKFIDIRNALLHNKVPANFELGNLQDTDDLVCKLLFDKCENIINQFN